jgi:predicted GIY-YIG superfamily endonuclease
MFKKYKNHIILGIILLVTLIIVGYALKWHTVYHEYISSKAIISDYLNEVKMDEFNNYVNENHNIAIYFGITDDQKSRNFENQFKKTVTKYQLRDDIVYLSLNDMSKENFALNLDTKYNNGNLKNEHRYLREIPALGIYQNAKLIDFISGDSLTTDTAIQLLNRYNLLNEWE